MAARSVSVVSNGALQPLLNPPAATAHATGPTRWKTILSYIRLTGRWHRSSQQSQQPWEIPHSTLSKRKRALSATFVPLLLFSHLIRRPVEVEITQTRPIHNESPRFGLLCRPTTFRPGFHARVTWTSIPTRPMSTQNSSHARNISDVSSGVQSYGASSSVAATNHTHATEGSHLQYPIDPGEGSSTLSPHRTPSESTREGNSAPQPHSGNDSTCGNNMFCNCHEHCQCWRSHAYIPLGLRTPRPGNANRILIPSNTGVAAESEYAGPSRRGSSMADAPNVNVGMREMLHGTGDWADVNGDVGFPGHISEIEDMPQDQTLHSHHNHN